MNAEARSNLLVVTRSPGAPTASLINRANDIASRFGLDVVELRGSELSDSAALAASSAAEFVMVAAGQNDDWVESLIQSPALERLEAPLWIQVKGSTDGIVLAAIGYDPAMSEEAVPDDDIISHARRVAEVFDTELHLLHAISQPSPLQIAADAITPAGTADVELRENESRRVAYAHELARKWQIPREQVHIHRGDFAAAIMELDESMHPSIVVLGASHPPLLARILGQSKQRMLVTTLDADMLLVNAVA
jgi:nucleotide-binding universal stress UspA family protein